MAFVQSRRIGHGVLVLPLLWATAAFPGSQPAWQDKVDPTVFRQALATTNWSTRFLVVLAEQADLAAAAKLRGKEAKGRYVFETLRARAAETQPALRLQIAREGGQVLRSFWIANMLWAQGDLLLVESLARRSDVFRISANPWVPMSMPATAPSQNSPLAAEWNISRINATGVWACGYTGDGVVIGGQDTGYAWTHPALKNKYRGYDGLTTNHNYNWHDAIHSGGGTCGADSTFPCDDQQHGTHTMGTMAGDDGAGNQIGVAPGAQWIGCRNMNVGTGSPVTYSECFEWFVAPTDLADSNPDPSKAPDVINNSWGCPASEGCTDVNVLKTVIENARAAGIMVVASAGNKGPSCSSVRDPPAIYEASLSVGNTDSSEAIAGDSSRGPVTADGSNRLKPDVSAPGSSIRSSVPGGGYISISGTSMAGPHVAGTVALILSAHPGLRGEVSRIEMLLEQTAVRRTTPQECGGVPGANIPNNTFGWGRVDAYEAVGLDDSDGDGIPNWWEVIFGLSRTNAADALLDPDQDGLSTYEEYICNTDPTNGASVLIMTAIQRLTNGAVQAVWQSRQDGFDDARRYRLYRTDDYTANTWTMVATNLAGAGDETAYADLPPAEATNRLYYCIAAMHATNEFRSRPSSLP